MLENNIQQALAQNNIDLEDAIDIRNVRNIKLANQLLKLRRKRKEKADLEKQQQLQQSQAMANAQAQQAAAQAEVQKQQVITQMQMQVEQMKSSLRTQENSSDAELKKQLMMLEFEMNMRLKEVEVESYKSRESKKEDRKDERTRIQASQQSELIDQRKTGGAPKKFESAGNDVLGGFDLGGFEPR